MLLIAAGLLVVGLVVDLGVVQPKLQRAKSLTDKLERMQTELAGLEQRQSRSRELADHLGAEDLVQALDTLRGPDPVVFLNSMVKEARLTQSELGTEEITEVGNFKRTNCYLRVRGRYSRVLTLLRTLEEGPRLVRVDDMALATARDGDYMESRFWISVYDPRGGQ